MRLIIAFLAQFDKTKLFTHEGYISASESKAARIINGVTLAIVRVSLALSPPIPLTSWVACIAIFFLAIGRLNNDGAYILLGIGNALFYVVIVIFMLSFCSASQISDRAKCFKERLFGYIAKTDSCPSNRALLLE